MIRVWSIAVCAVMILIGCVQTQVRAAAVEASEAVVTWVAPTTNDDGTPLTDLAGFRVKAGLVCGTPDVVVDNIPATATQGIMTGLPSGTYFFWVTAFDVSGNESADSQCVSALIPSDVDLTPPGAPDSLACTFTVTVPVGSAFRGQCVAVP